MEAPTKVKDFMITEVVKVWPDTPVVEAASRLFNKGYSGLPVVDESGRLAGIFTEYDLITKGTTLQLPTFLKIILAYDLYRRNPSLITEEVKKILELKVREVMNDDPLALYPETSLEEAVRTFSEHHRVNPIPIVDRERHLVGILSRADIVKLYASAASGRAGSGEAVGEFVHGFGRRFPISSHPARRKWLWLGVAFVILSVALVAVFVLRFLVLLNWQVGF